LVLCCQIECMGILQVAPVVALVVVVVVAAELGQKV
jgi:hypothetical protein